MGELLHFGTSKKRLQKEYEAFLGEEFPEIPEDDRLDDLFADLVEMDAYVSGMVSTFLKAGIKKKLDNYDTSFMNLLKKIDFKSKELNEILNRKKKLDLLVQIMGDIN